MSIDSGLSRSMRKVAAVTDITGTSAGLYATERAFPGITTSIKRAETDVEKFQKKPFRHSGAPALPPVPSSPPTQTAPEKEASLYNIAERRRRGTTRPTGRTKLGRATIYTPKLGDLLG